MGLEAAGEAAVGGHDDDIAGFQVSLSNGYHFGEVSAAGVEGSVGIDVPGMSHLPPQTHGVIVDFGQVSGA